jgi:hypothetical protein
MIRVARGAEIVVVFENRIDLPTSVPGTRSARQPLLGVPGVTGPGSAGRHVRLPGPLPDGRIYWYHPHAREDALRTSGYTNLLVDAPGAPRSTGRSLVVDGLPSPTPGSYRGATAPRPRALWAASGTCRW